MADALVALVERGCGGPVSAASLCSDLYKRCSEAKAVLGRHGGLKGFIANSPALEGKVKFVGDTVSGLGRVL